MTLSLWARDLQDVCLPTDYQQTLPIKYFWWRLAVLIVAFGHDSPLAIIKRYIIRHFHAYLRLNLVKAAVVAQ